MDRFTRFSLRNAAVIVMIALMVTAGGVYTSGELDKETMPDVSIPIVAIVTPYPGAAPTDVYTDVTEPLERALSSVQGMEVMNGTSADSVSVIVGEFGYSKDMDEVEAEMLEAIDPVELPENALGPDVVRISFGSQPILKVAVSGGGDPEALRDAVRDEVAPALDAIDGVGEVRLSSEDPGAVRVVFDAEALEANGLGARDVVQQLQAADISFPVGSVVVDGTEEPIRVSGTVESVEDIEDLHIAVYPNPDAMYGDALSDMGQGMGELGGVVGELGSAVGELGQGLGDLSEGLGTQIGLVSALQSTQSDLLDAKIALNEARTVLNDPEATPEEKAAAQQNAEQLSARIPALEQAVAGLEQQLEAAQQAAQGASPAVPTADAASSDLASPSLEPTAAATQPTIELVRLGELADIEYESGVEGMRSRMDGERAVLVDIIQSQDANTVEVSELVQAEIDSLQEELSRYDLEVTYDAADYINRSIWDMVREGLVGAVIAFLVMLVFLRNWRSTLIAAISIPLSVVAALLLIAQFDVTLNIMTLGGITVAIGRIVDDSIVVIENIYRHLQIGDERTPEMVRTATREVSGAITSSTLTTVAVFAPMALVSGIVGKIFTPFALTVAIALLASLLVSVTVVPLVAKWTLLKAKVPERDESHEVEESRYARILTWSLDHKLTVIAAALVLFVGSIALIPVVGLGFMPPATEKFANVDLRFPTGTTPETVDAALLEIEEELAGMEDVEFFQSDVGASSGFQVSSGDNQGVLFVRFDDDSDIDARIAELRDVAGAVASEQTDVTVSQADVSGSGTNFIDLIITGSDFEDIRSSADTIAEAVADVEGLENVSSNVSEERPQIAVEVDQRAAAERGLNAAMIAGVVRSHVADEEIGTIEVDGRDVSLLYSVGATGVASAEDVAAIEVASPLGEATTVGEVASVEETGTPVAVLTRDEQRYAAVSGAVTERDSSTVIGEVQAEIDALDLPEGVDVRIGGMAEMMNESFEQLILAMIVAVFAVYIVMVIAFGESIAPLAIMMSLPLAIIGGVLGLWITGLPLDMPAMIGALMLVGIVTTNAIVLIDRVNQRLDAGSPRRLALLEAGAERIRPILMTALTTIGALLPMAAGMAEGALMSQSLAVIVVGGLTTSTGLTLLVVPVVYDMLEGWKARLLGERSARPEPSAPSAEWS